MLSEDKKETPSDAVRIRRRFACIWVKSLFDGKARVSSNAGLRGTVKSRTLSFADRTVFRPPASWPEKQNKHTGPDWRAEMNMGNFLGEGI
ncbi:MAG: hypothetical protein MSK39_08935 [Dysosmobacter sp.]|nr:hypothetical protein [Dysosmobacter sp.]